MIRPGVARARVLTTVAAVSLLASCGAGDDVASESIDTTTTGAADHSAGQRSGREPVGGTDDGCGVTLADVQRFSRWAVGTGDDHTDMCLRVLEHALG